MSSPRQRASPSALGTQGCPGRTNTNSFQHIEQRRGGVGLQTSRDERRMRDDDIAGAEQMPRFIDPRARTTAVHGANNRATRRRHKRRQIKARHDFVRHLYL